ncbi:ABC transporter ATP-binding protein [Pedobacter duraquae]|uniref:Lipopolysaccharide transport system ATP-binding protein n=1 Tax=Pedobacter duraquae TaxID=425511 RepID=A0A4R6IMB5_9SPHI|nr:ABC transporter ATP-binding protein [Pedobacter duraquae]TDO23136.1 lipopolysaccharide transport system ATP-binding protein [Pedobacter duraquae]
MGTVIKAENLSKAYQLGEIGTGTISRDLERWWAKVRGKEDPFMRIGETNDRSIRGTSDIVWSLKDINFDVQQGDAVGIIGRNGAGKSTLLKILSRVTAPTTGSIKIKGRVASLLEVGTGFHPELSGRENIYLNGSILGMRKAEIKKHFDAIVDFSGVERYIDTPVKRYSSGMYVRLAFAVAAHLESEILVVDEVLAVGDAEFQKKCLGKMNDVSKGEGRTVLFVSHNMTAIRNLCRNSLLLNNGIIALNDVTEVIVDQYHKSYTPNLKILNTNTQRTGSGEVIFLGLDIVDQYGIKHPYVTTGDDLYFRFLIDVKSHSKDIDIGFSVHDDQDTMHSVLYSSFQGRTYDLSPGVHTILFKFEGNYLSNRIYHIRGLIKVRSQISDHPQDPLAELVVEPGNFYPNQHHGHQTSKLTFLIKGNWI